MTENLNKKPPKGILKSSSSFDTASCGGGGSVAAVRRESVGGGSASGAGCSRQSSTGNELTVGVDTGECCGGDNGEEYVHVRKHSKTAKFDEMNILETYHPATKTYGHMKIEEPKTPFNYYEDDEVDGEASSQGASGGKRRSKEINADELVKKLNECKDEEGGGVQEEVEEEEEESSSEEEVEDEESRATRMKFETKRKHHYNEFQAIKLARKLMQEDDSEDEDGGEGSEKPEVTVEGPEKFIPVEETTIRDNGDRMVTD